MARDSMGPIITRLRAIVGDPAGDTATWLDDELEEFLDERRTDVREARLMPWVPGGDGYTTFIAPRRWWEGDTVLVDVDGATLEPDTADLVSGRWTFTAGTSAPVYIRGACYDIYGSAQAVCEAWAAKVAREFDFGTDQQQFDRTGKREGLLKVAREFARKALPPGRMPTWHATDW